MLLRKCFAAFRQTQVCSGNHKWDPSFSRSLLICPQLRSEPVWPSSILTSFFLKWAQRWKNEEDLGEKLRAGWRVRQNANASLAKGITCKGKAKKQILYTAIRHSSLPPSLFSYSLHLSITIPFIVPLIFFSFFLTVESLKWQIIKHLGTEAPWALINASLVPKRIISRREWVLDGWRSSTNEIKISFLTQESFYSAISKITKDLNPFTFIFLWHNWELNLLPRDALMDIIINHPFFFYCCSKKDLESDGPTTSEAFLQPCPSCNYLPLLNDCAW